MSTITIFSDGAARGNPGPSAAGVAAVDAAGRVVVEYSRYLGKGTNNQAEYQGLIAALLIAESLGPVSIRLCLDSELVVRQMTGEYRIRNAGLKPLHARASALLGRLGGVTITHVAREANAIADRLANEAIDRYHEGPVLPGRSGGPANDGRAGR